MRSNDWLLTGLLLLLLLLDVIRLMLLLLLLLMLMLLLVTLFGRNNVMYVLFVAAQRASVAIGFITALNGTIERLPITVRLHVARQVIVPLESLRALVASKLALV